MNRELIMSGLSTKGLGRSPELYEIIPYSTNTRIRERLEAGEGHGICVAADLQLGGRGRLGRSWRGSEPGTMLPVSVALEWQGPVTGLPAITLAAALAVREAILQTAPELGANLNIKWPNDLLIGGRKVCGILTELCPTDHGTYAIVGVGVNLLQTRDSEDMDEYATSLLIEGVRISPEELLPRILNCLEKDYMRYVRSYGLGDMKQEYERALACLNRPVTVAGDETIYMCRGINEAGELLLESDEGLSSFPGGEISIRGDFYRAPAHGGN